MADYSSGDAPALTDYFDLVGKKPGSTTVTVTAANGVSKTINVTVKETTIESFTLEYKTNGNAIAQSSNELEVGETAMPTLTLTPAYATQKAMTYTISGDDDGVIELNTSTGMVTALKEGSATVKATPVYGTAGAQEFIIYTKARTGSNVTAPVFTVKASATEMAGANGTSSNPYTEPVTVEISCATANTTIYYTTDGTAPGITSTQYTAPIEIAATAANDIKAIAVSNDGKLTSATQTLSRDNLVIALRPLQLTLDQTAMNVTGATAFTLNATVTPEFAKLATSKNTFTWTSSNQDVIANGDIATSNNGLTATATPKAAGSTVITITSTADATVKAECKVTVADSKATGITLDKSSATLPTNEYLQLTATVTPSTALDKKVTWMTSNNAIATVADGLVTPIAKGTVVITAKIGTAYATCQVTVTDTATKVSAPVFTVAKASGEAVSGNNFAETGYVVTATSQTDGSTVVLTVYKDGAKVKAAGTDTYTLDANGTYTMSAYATKSGMESSDVVDATYVVSVPVKTVTIGNEASQETKGTFNATAKTLSLNGLVSYKLNATVNPANADVGTPAVTWTSSNPSVAEIYSEAKTIDGKSYAAGEVIAKSEGTATITATTTGAAEAKTDSITVTVKPVKVTGITMPTITNPKVNQQVTLKATVAPAEATNPAVTWAIVTRADSTGEATISGDVITFTKAGTIHLTATATDGSGITNQKSYEIGADDGTVVAPSVSIDGTEVSSSATITVAGKATMSTITMGSSIYYTTDGKTQRNGRNPLQW